MGRLHPTMNLLTPSIVAVLQEPPEGKPLTPLVALTLVLVCFGFVGLMIRSQEQERETGRPSSTTNFLEGCAGCFLGIIKIAFFLGFIALVLFGIIKAVKYAWFF